MPGFVKQKSKKGPKPAKKGTKRPVEKEMDVDDFLDGGFEDFEDDV